MLASNYYIFLNTFLQWLKTLLFKIISFVSFENA